MSGINAGVPPGIQSDFSTLGDLGAVVKMWLRHRSALKNYTYIAALTHSPNESPWPARLDLQGKGFLRSAFGFNFLYVLNEEIWTAMERGKTDALIDYSIGFDSNTANYVRGVVDGLGNTDDRAVYTEILRHFAKRSFNWDIIPYLTERWKDIVDGKDIDSIRSVIIAAERFSTCDRERFTTTGKVVSSLHERQLEANADRQLALWRIGVDNGAYLGMAQQHQMFYVVVLKKTQIQLRNPRGRDAPQKTTELITWFSEELGVVFPSLLWAAAQFFSRGSGFEFFVKILRKKENLLKNCGNIAWDAYHVFNRQQLAGNVMDDGSLTLPYFLTYDRGMAEFFDGFPQRGCFLHNKERSPQFIATDIVKVEIYERWREHTQLKRAFEKVFSEDEVHARQASAEMVKARVPRIVSDLERSLTA